MRVPRSTHVILIAVALGLACGPEPQRDAVAPAEAAVVTSGRIEGEAFLSGGDDASGTTVYCAGTNQVAFTDASGSYAFFEMPLGEYHLLARHEGYQEMDIGVHRITPEAPVAVVPSVTLVRAVAAILTLPDPVMGAISGRVTRGGGVSSAGIRVAVLGSTAQTRTDEQGRWLLRDVTPGFQTVQFSATGYEHGERQVEVLPDQLVEVPPAMLAPTPVLESTGDRRIFGTVALVGPDGTLHSDYRGVWVVLAGTSQTAAPDSRGRFEFAGLPPRVYQVEARADGYRDGEIVPVDLRESEEFEVTLFLDRDSVLMTPSGAVAGTVLLGDGGSAAGATVSVEGTGIIVTTGASGQFTIEGIPAGEVMLIAQAAGHSMAELAGVQIRPGETTDVGSLSLERNAEPPRVISSAPSDGERDVLLLPEVTVQVRFSTAMDAASVLETVEIDPDLPHRAAMGRGIEGADDDLLLIRFPTGEEGITHRDRVSIRIGASARSSEGIPMRQEHAMGFTMGEPELYASTPPDGSSGHPSDQPVTLRFNAELRTDVFEGAFTLSPRPPIESRVEVARDPETGWTIIHLVGSLTPDQRYTLRLSNRLRSLSGQRLGGTREISFETGPQMVYDYDGQPAPRDDSVVY